MSKVAMRILTVLFALILVIVCAIGIYALSWHFHRRETASKAEILFLKARNWRLNKTSGEEIAALGTDYRENSSLRGSCNVDCEVRVSFNDIPVRFNGRPFRELGIRPTTNEFWFTVRGGKLTSFHFSQGTLLRDGTTYLFSIQEIPDIHLQLNFPGRLTASRVLPRSSIVFERMYSPSISDSDWLRVMSFNFDCTSRWYPCTKLRDYMPDAWEEYATLQRAKGGSIFE